MKTGEEKNEHGIVVSTHACNTCGIGFTVCPAIPDDKDGWENCIAPECKSYDPERDIDVLFMSDGELAARPIVSMNMLRKRKQGVKLNDGTYAADLTKIESQ